MIVMAAQANRFLCNNDDNDGSSLDSGRLLDIVLDGLCAWVLLISTPALWVSYYSLVPFDREAEVKLLNQGPGVSKW